MRLSGGGKLPAASSARFTGTVRLAGAVRAAGAVSLAGHGIAVTRPPALPADPYYVLYPCTATMTVAIIVAAIR